MTDQLLWDLTFLHHVDTDEGEEVIASHERMSVLFDSNSGFVQVLCREDGPTFTRFTFDPDDIQITFGKHDIELINVRDQENRLGTLRLTRAV